ncbi:MAG TPA: c-type cytochrome biogenesis protein CcmI [Burkholderiaceae bacterium]|jgi:cytochrome c-type biogenesis protein CcmH
MITFWIAAALLILTALAFVLPPLLGKGNKKTDAISRDAFNIEILRNQLKELDADLAAGMLQQEQYELARNELQKRVLDEVSTAAPQLQSENRTSRMPAILLGVAVPALAVGLYFLLGNPQALAPESAANVPEMTQAQIDGMVNILAQRMEKQPDSKGLALLARSYTSMGRFSDAATTYGKLAAMEPQDADVVVEWADTLAMAQGRNLDGEPEKLITRALTLNPDHPKALALAGTIAYTHKDYAAALKHWRHLMTVVPPDSQLAQMIAPGIEQAQSLSGLPPQASAVKASKPAGNSKAVLTGKVEIDPALRSQVADTDTVFIFVRAAQGPRMPLVALRKQVRDLPISFSFDDAASLSPDRKLSSEANVVVGARISKTGDAMPQPTDIQVLSTTLTPNAKDVRLRLTRP